MPMNGAEWAGVILGSIGTVTGLGGLVYARRSAKASEQSAQTAKEAVDHQLETTRKANTARVVRHEPLGFARDGSTVKIGLKMYNEGPAPAHNLQMFISWPGNDPDNERDPRTRE